MRNKILLVIIAALLSAQAQGVVESGQHTQWGTLRYQVRPGQYTVIGELIQGGGVVGIPRVDNPNPQVDAEQVRRSTVRYTPSRDRGRPPEGGSGDPLILRDPDGNPVAYFNDEQEARHYLGDRLFNQLNREGQLITGQHGNLPHYTQCGEACREIASAAEEFRRYERYNAERALQGFLETVREVAQAIIDFVESIVQAVVDFFADIFGWVREEAEDIMASIDNDDDDEDEDEEDDVYNDSE